MVYNIILIAPKNQLNFESLLGYIWDLYSDMTVSVFGYEFDYAIGLCLCGGD